MGNCHSDWLIRPSPWALKPLLSISLQQKTPHLGYNTYFPFKGKWILIFSACSCQMIPIECTVLLSWMEMTFYVTSHNCLFSQPFPFLINSDLISYKREQAWCDQVWRASVRWNMMMVTPHKQKCPNKYTHIRRYQRITSEPNETLQKQKHYWDKFLMLCNQGCFGCAVMLWYEWKFG